MSGVNITLLTNINGTPIAICLVQYQNPPGKSVCRAAVVPSILVGVPKIERLTEILACKNLFGGVITRKKTGL